MVTDHTAMVAAQRKQNGLGSIGHSYHREVMFRYVNDLFLKESTRVVPFFPIRGINNPSETYWRNFGDRYTIG